MDRLDRFQGRKMSIRTVLAKMVDSTGTARPPGSESRVIEVEAPVANSSPKPPTGEVAQILAVWRGLGLYLDRNTVSTHLADLRRWQDQ